MLASSDQVKAAYEQELASRSAPMTAEDIPFAYEDITTEWLTSVLCNGLSNVEVASYRLDVPDNATSNRRRIFIEYSEGGADHLLPKSVFCKASQSLDSRITLSIAGLADTEVKFYNLIRSHLKIEAPSCFHARMNLDTYNSIVVLNDLGSDVEFCRHDTDISLERAKSQLRLLARVHGAYLEHPELNRSLSGIQKWTQVFGHLNYPALQEAAMRGLEAAEDITPQRLFARRDEIWPATLQSVELHNNLPHTITHGDVHLGNWYIAASGEMGLNDWQITNIGHWSRDLVYTITTSLSVENRRAWEQELMSYYIEQLRSVSGKSISTKGLFDLYRQQLMSSLAFWTVTLTPVEGMVEEMQPQDATREFIRRMVTAIDDLDVLDSF